MYKSKKRSERSIRFELLAEKRDHVTKLPYRELVPGDIVLHTSWKTYAYSPKAIENREVSIVLQRIVDAGCPRFIVINFSIKYDKSIQQCRTFIPTVEDCKWEAKTWPNGRVHPEDSSEVLMNSDVQILKEFPEDLRALLENKDHILDKNLFETREED